MGRELTKRHSLLFEKTVTNPFLFAHDIYNYGKLCEFVSFIVWELFHKLGLFPKKKYLKCNNSDALTLEKERLHNLDIRETFHELLGSRGLSVTSCDHNWKRIVIKNNGKIYECLYPNHRDLHKSSDKGKSLIFVKTFPVKIKSIFVSSQNTIFVCAEGAVYESSDNGDSSEKS